MVKETRLQTSITFEMENYLKECAKSLGMNKNEYIRFLISNEMKKNKSIKRKETVC